MRGSALIVGSRVLRAVNATASSRAIMDARHLDAATALRAPQASGSRTSWCTGGYGTLPGCDGTGACPSRNQRRRRALPLHTKPADNARLEGSCAATRPRAALGRTQTYLRDGTFCRTPPDCITPQDMAVWSSRCRMSQALLSTIPSHCLGQQFPLLARIGFIIVICPWGSRILGC